MNNESIKSAMRIGRSSAIAWLVLFSYSHVYAAPNVPDRIQRPPATRSIQPQFQSSPFKAPEANDVTFVVDSGPGLDTGCTFRSGGPLVFEIPVDRYVGNVQSLLAAGAIEKNAFLRMPAFDVDFGGAPNVPPERDRVLFNGEVVDGEFLTGDNGVWKLNGFKIPVEKILFPNDPGEGGVIQPRMNRVEIHIDVLSVPDENWCTSIDWAALTFKVARPHLLVHGIFSQGGTWAGNWTTGLGNAGIPFATIDMGRLDGVGANAGKIAARVQELKNRWGVDALNIVAHSKGGIDSRHYIENSTDITRLIQIGTPNAGSPLANYIQAGSYMLLGPALNIVANGLAGGPGGYQLTTPYMDIYNAFHGFNPKTEYYSMAGDYRGGGLVDNVLNSLLPGPDDTIVPMSSVHVLPYSAPSSIASFGPDRQAAHTAQTQSGTIFNAFLPISKMPQGPSPFVSFAQQVAADIVATETLSGTIGAGQVRTHTVPVDQVGPGAFIMFYGAGDLDLALISPAGVRIDRTTVSRIAGASFESNETIDGFKNEAYHFQNLAAGTWTVEITGGTIPNPPGAETYFVSAWLEASTISLTASTRAPNYSVGDAVIIEALLRNGAALLVNANVTANVRQPDDVIVPLTLLDNGTGADAAANDGIYTGILPQAPIAGVYQIGVTARGATPGFSRSAFLTVPVAASTTHFGGAVTDRGVDTNQNGLFDELAVDVPVVVTHPATYLLMGQLQTATGQLLGSFTRRQQLSPGTHSMRLTFDGQTIFRSGIDGPYELSVLRLAEETSAGDVLPLAAQSSPYQTQPYGFRAFEREAIYLSGGGRDAGVDTNGNGRFDALEVDLDVDLLVAGRYEWTARLIDRNDSEIGFATNAGTLTAGAGSLKLVFDGARIGRNGVDGPYRVVDLLVFGAGQSQIVFQAYATTAYSVRQFEGSNLPPVCTTAVPSIGTLWPPNHKLVNIAINGVTDPDGDPIAIVITGITQDEPVDGKSDGHTAPDGAGVGSPTASVRAERSGKGNGRVYAISFSATDGAGSCQSMVKVGVPKKKGGLAIDSGQRFDSTVVPPNFKPGDDDDEDEIDD